MPNSNSSTLTKILDQVTPDILGIFWITEKELNRDLLYFDQFNYLFDGLISQYLYGQDKEHHEINNAPSNIFFTHNFNQPLFLAHFKLHHEISGALDDQIALIQESNKNHEKKILVFNQTEKVRSLELKKRYPHFDFINLKV